MIQQILEQFRGIKNLSQIKSARKKTLIPKMKNARGETVTSRKGTANVFAEFYSKRYAEEKDDNEECDHCRAGKNTSSRGQKSEDNNAAIDSLKKGKASDNDGIRTEDIKACSEKTKEMMRQIFNEVLKPEDCTTTTLRRARGSPPSRLPRSDLFTPLALRRLPTCPSAQTCTVGRSPPWKP